MAQVFVETSQPCQTIGARVRTGCGNAVGTTTRIIITCVPNAVVWLWLLKSPSKGARLYSPEARLWGNNQRAFFDGFI